MADYEIGDVVELKSGGPWMTVVGSNSSGETVCEWFNTSNDGNRTVQRHVFPPDALNRKKD